MKRLLLAAWALTMLQLTGLKSQAQVTEAENADTTQSTLVRYGQALELLNRIKVSGYIQAQAQFSDSSGQQSFAGGNFPSGTDKRFAIRRGRVKFQYDSQIGAKGWSTSQYVLQFDVTEKGLTIKDAYLKFTDPWTGWLSITGGMQNRPFGYEVPYSSSQRESPERGRMSQIIFPGERDMGFMLTVQAPKTSKWNFIKLDAGVFNGTGARGAGLDASDFDKYKDIIGRLSITKSTPSERIKYGIGVSGYFGGFRQEQVDAYTYGTDSLGVKGFLVDVKKADIPASVAVRPSVKRNYLGVDAQFSIDWFPGITTLRAEYIQGLQPGTSSSTTSAAAVLTENKNTTVVFTDTSGAVKSVTTSATINSDIYSRNFNGAYFYFLQNIAQTPFQLIVKYDWYDPNTDVKGDEIGQKVASPAKATGAADIKYETWGFGLSYRWDANVKITAYYDMVKNETTNSTLTGMAAYNNDLKDNVFTLRLQVKF